MLKKNVTCSLVLLACIFLLALPASASAVESHADVYFQSGIKSFKTRHYKLALENFIRARQNGMRTPQLTYNIGVTYFRLGQYVRARTEFRLLTSNTSQAPLAHYNLGLIANRLNQRQEAKKEFETAYRTAKNVKIKHLAREQLHRLGYAKPASYTWIGFATAAAGYDDNVALRPSNTLVAPSGNGSSKFSILAGGVGQLTGDYRHGLQIVGTFYRVDYPSLSAFSQTYLHAGVQYRLRAYGWKWLFGGYGGYLTLNGNNFETLGSFKVEAKRQVTRNNTIAASYRYMHITGGSSYTYLTGWRQSIGASDRWQGEGLKLSVGYLLDLNRRDDLQQGSQFFSVSPTENTIYARLKWDFSTKWQARLYGRYRNSHYNDPDILNQGNTLTTITRQDNLYSVSTALAYKITPHVSLVGRYRYLRNNSNVSFYQYTSNEFMLSLEALFL